MIHLMRLILVFISVMVITAMADAKKKVQYRKTQEVNFSQTNIDGVGRSPDGSYLHNKRGVKFFPLYKVKKNFTNNIKNSVDYLR